MLEGEEILVDENGVPIDMRPGTGEGIPPGSNDPELLDEEFIDNALGRRREPDEPVQGDPFQE